MYYVCHSCCWIMCWALRRFWRVYLLLFYLRSTGETRRRRCSFNRSILKLYVVCRRKSVLAIQANQYPVRVRSIVDFQLGILRERELLVGLSCIVEKRASMACRLSLCCRSVSHPLRLPYISAHRHMFEQWEIANSF